MNELNALSGIVGLGEYDPSMALKHFFGEPCLLVSAAREALATGAGSTFLEVVEVLLGQKESFRQIYGVGSRDQLVWDQGWHLLQGLAETLVAACFPSDDIDWPRIQTAVREFDLAWPQTPGESLPAYGLPKSCPDALARYCREVGPRQTTGFWVVWDILDALPSKHTYPSAEFRPQVKTASLPVLLFGEDGHSQVASLTVDLVFDGGDGFRPDPLGLGLTTLGSENPSPCEGAQADSTNGEGNFLVAMRNAWRIAGLPSGCRGRWRITAYRPPDQEDSEVNLFATPYLAGRSAEAAACCAIWAAWGCAPGDVSGERIELDPQGTVTATLEGGPGKLAQLGSVGGIPGKLKAAREAGLQLVVVSTGQPEQDFEDHRAVRPDDPVPVKTIQEAFEALLSYHQILGDHQESVKAKWLDRWEPGTADGLEPV